jgi:twinkle protein
MRNIMSRFLRHEACPKCGSNDNVVVYYNDELGGETYYCMTKDCDHKKTDYQLDKEVNGNTRKVSLYLPEYNTPKELRGITPKTQQLYSVGTTNNELILPYYKGGSLIAYKQYKRKLKEGKKDMPWVGDARSVGLFGIQTTNSSRQILIITEGEIDAMSAQQMTGYASVSIPHGANNALKSVKENLKFIESFPKTIICFDNDEAGLSAADEVCDFLKSGSTYRATLRLKDANEYLKQGLTDEFKNCIKNSSQKPSECLYTDDEVKALVSRIVNQEFNVLTGIDTGIIPISRFRLRPEEVTTVFADPAVGKSSFCRQIVANLIRQKIGVLMFCLEESDETYVSKTLNMFYHEKLTPKRRKELEPDIEVNFTPYLHLAKVYDDNLDNIKEAIEYGVRVNDVKLVLFDNVSAATACSGDSVNKIGSVYMTMTELGKRYGHHTIVVSHTRRQPPKGGGKFKNDEDNDVQIKIPSMTDGLGSGGIERYSYNVIALAREDNVTSGAIRKHRTTGDLWEFTLTWDSETHSFNEVKKYGEDDGEATRRDGQLVGSELPESSTPNINTSPIQEKTRDVHCYDF